MGVGTLVKIREKWHYDMKLILIRSTLTGYYGPKVDIICHTQKGSCIVKVNRLHKVPKSMATKQQMSMYTKTVACSHINRDMQRLIHQKQQKCNKGDNYIEISTKN